MLAGIVNVTLEEVELRDRGASTGTSGAAEEWREYFNLPSETRVVPEVVDDPTFDSKRCVLETPLGQTELGVELN